MSEQENTPVAWQKQVRHKESGQLSWVDENEYVSGWSYEETGEMRALYAQPRRKWAPLTAEELQHILDTTHPDNRWTLAERVEYRLRDKNGGQE